MSSEEKTPIEDLEDDTPIEVKEDAVSPTTPVIVDELEDEEEDVGFGEKKNTTWSLFGNEYDVDTTVVLLLTIVIWIIIWRSSGLYKTLRYDPIFIIIFLLFILYSIINIFTSGTTSGGVVHELNILLTVEQMISILFGTVVLFALFFNKIPLHQNCKSVVYRLTLSIIIILTTASLWVNVITSGRAFRAIRKFKQGIYNISLALFILIGLIALIRNDISNFKEIILLLN
jgi:hypothetical protein